MLRSLWKGSAKRDSLATGVLFLCGLTIAQRLIGLVRNVIFCGWLNDDELGRWALAFNFLMLAAPLAVLGIPGSFGRYVEHYRQRGQLRAFLRRTLGVTGGVALAASAAMLVFPRGVAGLLYGDAQYEHLAAGVGLGLLVIILFNALVELLVAMRLVRAATVMQFVSSVAFAALGLAFLRWSNWREEGVLAAFLCSSLLGGLVAVGALRQAWRELPKAEPPLPGREMWSRLVPFASWIWLANLTGNLFEMADQFLIKHALQVSPLAADGLLGQYYFARVIPTVMISVGVMLAGMLLPYWIADWEEGRRAAVGQRLNQALILIAVAFTAGGAAALWAGPPVLNWAFGDKYALGVSLLPWLFPSAIWYSLAMVALKYVACAERNSLGTLAIFLSLLLSVAANLVLLPVAGLLGAAMAASLSSGLLLGLALYFSARLGLRVEPGVAVAAVLPLTLTLGPLGCVPWLALFLLLAAGQGGLRCEGLWRYKEAVA